MPWVQMSVQNKTRIYSFLTSTSIRILFLRIEKILTSVKKFYGIFLESLDSPQVNYSGSRINGGPNKRGVETLGKIK